MCSLLYKKSALKTNGCKTVGNCLKSVRVGQCSTEPKGCPGVTAPSQAGGQGEMLEQLGIVLLSAFFKHTPTGPFSQPAGWASCVGWIQNGLEVEFSKETKIQMKLCSLSRPSIIKKFSTRNIGS